MLTLSVFLYLEQRYCSVVLYVNFDSIFVGRINIIFVHTKLKQALLHREPAKLVSLRNVWEVSRGPDV